MTDEPNDRQCIECRLVVIDKHSMRVLTIAGASGPLLPREVIPVYARVAQALTDAIRQRYELCTIQLALLRDAEGPSYCAVYEIIGSGEGVPGSLSFTSLDEIGSGELTGEEQSTVLEIMSRHASPLGRFARLGWVEELFVRTGIYPDRSASTVVRQVNHGIDFCLLSMTDAMGRKVWFKAVGEPNTREYPLTLELAERFPAYLPKILATVPEWNGWVMEHVESLPFNKSDPTDQCQTGPDRSGNYAKRDGWLRRFALSHRRKRLDVRSNRLSIRAVLHGSSARYARANLGKSQTTCWQ